MRVASWLIAVLVAAAPHCVAQSTPLPMQTTSGTGFAGAPYSAKETTVTERTLTDGTRTTQTFVELLWRDADGRTRREIIRHNASDAEASVIITDPVGGMYFRWMVGNESIKKVAHIWPLRPEQRVTAPPPSDHPSPQGNTPRVQLPVSGREILPPQEINGVYAEGSRTVRTIHLDEESNGRSIEVMNELWVSPELMIIVRHIHDDPRSGRSTTNVTDVVRRDPEAKLFQPPAGYEVVDHRPQRLP